MSGLLRHGKISERTIGKVHVQESGDGPAMLCGADEKTVSKGLGGEVLFETDADGKDQERVYQNDSACSMWQ